MMVAKRLDVKNIIEIDLGGGNFKYEFDIDKILFSRPFIAVRAGFIGKPITGKVAVDLNHSITVITGRDNLVDKIDKREWTVVSYDIFGGDPFLEHGPAILGWDLPVSGWEEKIDAGAADEIVSIDIRRRRIKD